MKKHFRVLLIVAAFGIVPFTAVVGPQNRTYAQGNNISDNLFSGLRWRNIGPFHGGRISAVTGAVGQAGVFYVGAPLGGIWKTSSAGVVWSPIFDQFTNVDSIGAVQVAPSDPNIVYAGTGDSVGGSLGDGMYKSTDAGKTWTHTGLEDTIKINRIIIDPHDANLVLASTEGDAKHKGQGVYRSTDGGKTWLNVLKPEHADGTRDLAYAFDIPTVMFAASAGAITFPGAPQPKGPNGTALFKSTDEGQTWTKIDTLPPYTGRIGVAVAMHTNGQRLYVIGNPPHGGSGLYRSDDQGATWRHMAEGDPRVSNGQGGYSSGVWVDSGDPDILYTVATTVYRSTDGGKTFSAFKGAPGGEDPHDLWIDPTNGQRMLFGLDQGAAVTLDGGRTWSGYYQIPIAQLYHVSTDNRYPYWVIGAQQDTGAVMVRSRSDQGQITTVDWLPVPSSEFGTLTADPLHPDTIYGLGYGAGQGNGLLKIDLATGQWGNVAPNFGSDANLYRASRDFWKRFDTAFDPKTLYVGYNCIMTTRDGAETWKAFSPDLTTPKGQPAVQCGVAPPPPPPPAKGAPAPAQQNPFRMPPPPAISDFSLSTVKKGVVWTGSSNGQIYNTMDGGKTWNNVTNFTDLPKNADFVTVEAGHHDVDTAYVAVNISFPRGTPPPPAAEQNYIYRTHDGGKTWTLIVNGLPIDERTGSEVHVVREDPKQKGLLFAGTETTVYVSFDDGDHWQSLRLNLPSTSIRDMVFHTDDHMNDLVIATYGRGFWVLDDMSPLREVAAKSQQIAAAPAYLFKPGDAIRSRMNSNWDQPMNPEMPHAENPPFGALIYYHLSKKPAGEIKLQIFDSENNLVRTITSIQPPMYQRPPYPDYWLMSSNERALSTEVGTNRINWDLRYDDPPGVDPDINNQMNSAPDQVTPAPHGPAALPGTYTVKLLVDGATYTQTLVLHNDPRVGEGASVMAALRAQNKLALAACRSMKESYDANKEVTGVREQVEAVTHNSPPPDVAKAAEELDKKLATFGSATLPRRFFGRGGPAPKMTPFNLINLTFYSVLGPLTQNGMDIPPTKAEIDTWESGCKEYTATVSAWNTMIGEDLSGFNSLLTKNNLAPLKTPGKLVAPSSCRFEGPAARQIVNRNENAK